MMRKWTLDHPRLWLVLMIAALLSLAPLAWLQYRWIGQISEAERERRRAHLEAAVSRFVRDVDWEVVPLFRFLLYGRLAAFRGDPPDLATSYTRFLEAGGEPRLIKNLYSSEGGEGGTQELLRMEPATGRLTLVAWPPALEPLRARLRSLAPTVTAQLVPPQPSFEEQALALFAPRWQMLPRDFPPPMPPWPRPATMAGWSIIEVDLDYFSKELLPSLVQRHFLESGRIDYQVRIVSERKPPRTIYTTDAALPAGFFSSPDASAPLFHLRPERAPRFPLGAPGQPPFAMRPQPPPFPSADAPPREPEELQGAWRLLVRHRAGSLEAAVAQTRHRNLAISLAILLLMAASLAALLASTRRAQRLARMQMEFVAGVSHELRTPLSVICSAGDNLADGLVSGVPQVRRYGSVVRSEGRRLSQMVEKILGFAGIQSGRVKYELQPVDVGEVVAGAVAAIEPDIRAASCTLESRIDPDLPQVLADATSLTYCLRNLLDNALTHGSQGQWIGVRATAATTGAGRLVEIVVEDRGPGIDPRDLPHLFEPFYRGRRAVQEQMHGFGLGLTLAKRIVEAHSGTLTVESAPDKGTRFFVRIPALPGSPIPFEEEDDGPTDSADRG